MSKSKWKIKFLDLSILKLGKLNPPLRKKKNIWSKSSIIPEFLIGSDVRIYTGKTFVVVRITKERVGYKFGEFVHTRKRTFKVQSKNFKKWGKK